jgi:hypothetical protein
MVNAIQSRPQWASHIAHEGSMQKPPDEVFIQSSKPQPKKTAGFELFGADGFTASDAIDIVNPLQHLPVIGPLYREFTGNSLDPFSRIIGNTLFFGLLGAALSSINVAVEEITGKDVGSNVIAMLKSENTITTEPQATRTNPVNPPTTAVGKNKAIDPVLAWATAEISHRNIEALKQGIDIPTRSYSTLFANTMLNSIHLNQNTAASAQPEPAKQTLNQVQKPKALVQKGPLALKVLKSDLLTSPTTLEQVKRTTNSYTSITASVSQPSIEQPTSLAASKTNQSQTLTSNSTNGGWLSPSMNDALSKYHQAKNFRYFHDKANIPHISSLH